MTTENEGDKGRADEAGSKGISKDPKGESKQHPHPGHQVPHGSGEGATGMQPGAGHPRGR